MVGLVQLGIEVLEAHGVVGVWDRGVVGHVAIGLAGSSPRTSTQLLPELWQRGDEEMFGALVSSQDPMRYYFRFSSLSRLFIRIKTKAPSPHSG